MNELTDRELATMITEAVAIERRLVQATRTSDLAARDGAVVGARHATALRKSLEGWMSARAVAKSLAVNG